MPRSPRDPQQLALIAAIMALRPGAEWMLDGNTLAGLTWLDKTQTMPTQAEIDAYVPPPPPPPPPPPTPQQKLAALGLTVADLRSLLGLPTPPTPPGP